MNKQKSSYKKSKKSEVQKQRNVRKGPVLNSLNTKLVFGFYGCYTTMSYFKTEQTNKK